MANDHVTIGLLSETGKLTSRSRGDKQAVSQEMAEALDASTQDLLHGRTEEIGEFIKDRRVKLKAHLDRKTALRR